MVRSDSADEEQIITDDGFDLIEEDEEMSPGVDGSVPVVMPDWSSVKNGKLVAAMSGGGGGSDDYPQSPIISTNSSFDLTNSPNNSMHSIPASGPLLTNRSISQPAPLSPQSTDPERRIRRQIANCNERRRMQSINAGFMALRSLLPRKEGEKLSKAAILQQTADLVHQLLQRNYRNVNATAAAEGGCEPKKPKLDEDYMDMSDYRTLKIIELQDTLENEFSKRRVMEQEIIRLKEALRKALNAGGCSPPMSIPTNPTQQFSMHPAYVNPTISGALTSQEERKPSIHDSTSSPLSMLNLNGSPSSSESMAAAPTILTPTLNMNPPFSSLLETTVIRPTPLAPISVEVSSPTLSTPSPMKIQQSMGPLIFTTPQPTQSIMFPTAVHPVTSSVSTGNSTPVTLPPLSIQHNHSQPSAFVSTQTTFAAHHSLQTIIDAIRHLEGNSFLPPSPPPTSQTSLVR